MHLTYNIQKGFAKARHELTERYSWFFDDRASLYFDAIGRRDALAKPHDPRFAPGFEPLERLMRSRLASPCPGIYS